MKKNTSISNLNADHELSFVGNIVWILLNIINNNYLPNKIKNLCIKKFCPKIDKNEWEKIHPKSSPSRFLSNLFWLKLDWEAIKSELGRIDIFDTGAGNGAYALKLNDFAEGISTYYGIDTSPHKGWKNLMREYDFIIMKQAESIDILDYIPNRTNFFMSQSAIEHFENDLVYFNQINNFIRKTNKNTIQVHLFPSAACLKLYAWHGVRQYTPRTISKIVQLFKSQHTYSILFKLGGKKCNNLHYQFITRPLLKKREDWRNFKTEEYRELVKIAIENDIKHRRSPPSFYALIIHSNFKKPIFKQMESLTRLCT